MKTAFQEFMDILHTNPPTELGNDSMLILHEAVDLLRLRRMEFEGGQIVEIRADPVTLKNGRTALLVGFYGLFEGGTIETEMPDVPDLKTLEARLFGK